MKITKIQADTLSFTAASDQGESEAFLRSQLRLVHEILLMVFGPVALTQKKNTFLKQHKFLQKLIDTMCWLSERKQSFLVEVTNRTNYSFFF